MRVPEHFLSVSETIFFDMQRRVVAHMTQGSWKSIPHAAVQYEPDVTGLIEQIELLKKSNPALKLNLTTVMIKIITEGLKKSPELNSHLQYNSFLKTGSLRTMSSINISIPWLLEDGRMITPVLRNVESMTLSEIVLGIETIAKKISRTEIDELLYESAFKETLFDVMHLKITSLPRIFAASFGKNRIKRMNRKKRRAYYAIPEKDRLIPDDLASGTVLISNAGSLYPKARSVFTLLEIIPPQVFVIGMSALQKRAIVITGESGTDSIAVRKILPLLLAFDHRASDYAALVPFQKRIDEICAKPDIIREWI